MLEGLGKCWAAGQAPVSGGRNLLVPKVAIPCRVSSDPHERRNDLDTVSTIGSGVSMAAKMPVTAT